MVQIQFDEETIKGDSMSNAKIKNKELSNSLKKDLRSSHFQFGNSNDTIESWSHSNHKKFTIDQKEKEESGKLAKKMQSTNFIIGNKKKREMIDSSTYKDLTSNSLDFISRPKQQIIADIK